MQEEIDMSQIPPEYGGSSDRAIGDSDDERKVCHVPGFAGRSHGAALCLLSGISLLHGSVSL